MKKTLLLILFFVCTALCSAVQARVGMFIGYDRVADQGGRIKMRSPPKVLTGNFRPSQLSFFLS